jgi:protein-S-isoprenylcysteine O-methyltransferase Ste14
VSFAVLGDLTANHYVFNKIKVCKMELKIPPILIVLMVAAFMWGISKISSLASIESEVTGPLSLMMLIVGLALNIAAIVSFRNANTTMNPMKPKSAARLVNAGIYKLSRNPMYLGTLFILFSWSIWLGNFFNLAVFLFFVWYITKFQIIPEEKVLEELFPKEFKSYKSKVRRWI